MEKSAEAFRTISEVSEILETPAHVLRFWESRFSQVRPVKRAGGRRYYRPNDLALLGGIKRLLHEDGLTIRGVQKILKEQGVRHVAGLSKVDLTQPGAEPTAPGTVPADMPEPRPQPTEAAAAQDRVPPKPKDIDVTVVDDLFAAAERARAHPKEPAPEAPMEVDVPTLPRGGNGNVHPLGARSEPDSDRPAQAPEAARQRHPAALLRAMDARRLNDRKSDLKSVYERLVAFRERLSRSDGTPRG